MQLTFTANTLTWHDKYYYLYIYIDVYAQCNILLIYFSDTGVDIPESCVFSQFFNIAAFLGINNTTIYQDMYDKAGSNI